MKSVNNARMQARKLLDICGLDEITDMDMDLFVAGLVVAGLDAILIEEELANCDGKVIFGNSKSVIKVNSRIQFQERKRFVAAHEIGHVLMHRNMRLPDDTFANFNVIEGMENTLKNGRQELEANEFASELLMPEKIFLKEAKGKKFTPLLIKQLAERFRASLTATVFRYLQFGQLHPICIVFIENGRVKYWKKSDDLKVWMGDYNRLAPPTDSVAMEYLQKDYDFVYKLEEKAQIIKKSTWFNLNQYDEDTDFYEYCIPTKRYQTILSIIWED
ncbi:ImmA/IrrE family metallo-endopeptidase [Parapedobacter sp. ISTM3]|uniref:ImmA/IrrE family metallo-endopeptidase n=1 Tax=Parapedobacter sp. ISTM3 TaxID=2800130 RepID=UPI0019085A16|nr:ImmA/IrrE family metallo-endopeptidase [Parapedobacter sp. ISTM3]MBK1439977.1 ImmA/IrrE family metallo-endopeptidase [Parapedobacter sp. ISTM3]